MIEHCNEWINTFGEQLRSKAKVEMENLDYQTAVTISFCIFTTLNRATRLVPHWAPMLLCNETFVEEKPVTLFTNNLLRRSF